MSGIRNRQDVYAETIGSKYQIAVFVSCIHIGQRAVRFHMVNLRVRAAAGDPNRYLTGGLGCFSILQQLDIIGFFNLFASRDLNIPCRCIEKKILKGRGMLYILSFLFVGSTSDCFELWFSDWLGSLFSTGVCSLLSDNLCSWLSDGFCSLLSDGILLLF